MRIRVRKFTLALNKNIIKLKKKKKIIYNN
jgi:hypothetical protein